MRRSFERIRACLLILAVAACGGSSNSGASFDKSASTDIVNGDPTGSKYGNVGAVMYDFAGDGLDADDWFCSGSLIAPTVFLTAAHCLEFLPKGAQVYVTFAPSAAEGVSTAIAATAFHFDPLYGHDSADPHDIGVVILPKAPKGIAPMQLPPAAYLDQLNDQNGLKDSAFLNIGYGGDATRTGKPTISYDGVRKVSISTFMALEKNWLWLSMNSSTGDGGDCYGDSGGPKVQASKPNVVVALVVTGDANCRATTKDYRTDSPSARAFLGNYVRLP